MFEIVDRRRTDDGRTPEHGYTISSPCEPKGSGEIKSEYTLNYLSPVIRKQLLLNANKGADQSVHLFGPCHEKTRLQSFRPGLTQTGLGECTGLVVRAWDSGSGDPGSILGRVGVLFP